MLPTRFIARVLVAVGAVIPVTVAVALASSTGADVRVAGPSPQTEAMEGAFSNSSDPGEAVFRARGLDPGDTVDGTVLVTNEGSSRGLFWLARTDFADRQGPAGGSLSERLQLTVLDVSAPDSPLLVYTGGLDEMGARPLGFIAPGKARIYSVAATLLPDRSGSASTEPHPYEGSSTTVTFAWNAIAGEPPTGEERAMPKADASAPRLSLEFPRSQRLLETGSLTVFARCDERCSLDATGRLLFSGDRRPTAATAQRGAKGVPARVRVNLGPSARRALRKSLTAGKAVPVQLSVTARDGAGNAGTTTRKIWLRPAR